MGILVPDFRTMCMTPLQLFPEVTQVRFHRHMVSERLQQREVPHLVRHAGAVHLEDDAPQLHHEAVPARGTVALRIDQILE